MNPQLPRSIEPQVTKQLYFLDKNKGNHQLGGYCLDVVTNTQNSCHSCDFNIEKKSLRGQDLFNIPFAAAAASDDDDEEVEDEGGGGGGKYETYGYQ